MDVFDLIMQYITAIRITDIIDILLVAFIIYKGANLIKNTSAGRLVKGIILIIVIMLISGFFDLNTLHYILKNTMQVGLIAIIVVFQPELRSLLEQVGKRSFSILEREKRQSDRDKLITGIVDACSVMSKNKIGALIVIERGDIVSDMSKSATILNADISSELLQNIFMPKSPLHDGAVIIKNDKIYSAGAILPLSSNRNLSKELGTRHRSAVGTTEIYDCICIVVSEESGSISISTRGMLKRHLNASILEKLLISELVLNEPETNNKHSFFSRWRNS